MREDTKARIAQYENGCITREELINWLTLHEPDYQSFNIAEESDYEFEDESEDEL